MTDNRTKLKTSPNFPSTHKQTLRQIYIYYKTSTCQVNNINSSIYKICVHNTQIFYVVIMLLIIITTTNLFPCQSVLENLIFVSETSFPKHVGTFLTLDCSRYLRMHFFFLLIELSFQAFSRIL